MSTDKLASIIEEAFEGRDKIGPKTRGAVRKAVNSALDSLDAGKARVAERQANGQWHVNQWLKKAVLLSFRLNDMGVVSGGPGKAMWWDKVDPAEGLERGAIPQSRLPCRARLRRAALRIHRSRRRTDAVFCKSWCLRRSGTMIDTWATVGSCAQVGKNCHISGGAGIGGVLEPLQAGPVIIEDSCFIGARSEVAEGVIVRTGAVLSMGVYLGASTRIVDRDTGAITQGEVPPYSVVVPGMLPGKNGGPGLYCAVIVKRVDERTRSKTSINELLRD